MKLEKFKKNKRFNNILLTLGIASVILGGGILVYRSYAFYEEKAEYNVLKGQVGNFIKSDVNIIAMSLDGQEITKTPEKNDYIVNVTCDKEAEAYWDTEIWGLVVKDFEKGIKCSVDFETKYLTNYIKYLANTSDELLVDETEDQNIRYVGANPNNYVSFNNELWRIIGVMNDVKNEEGISESRVKLVRVGSIGSFSWDYKADGTYGENWETATIKDLLNGPYYNRSTGTYYNYVANTEPTPTTVNFTETGLSEEARNQIEVASWHIGQSQEIYSKNPYVLEKQTLWKGNIGLLNVSDIMYSVLGNELIDKNTCYETNLYYWTFNSEFKECKNTAWALNFLNNNNSWSMNNDNDSKIVVQSLRGSNLYTYATSTVNPSVYLKSNIYYVSGAGSSTDPFIIK